MGAEQPHLEWRASNDGLWLYAVFVPVFLAGAAGLMFDPHPSRTLWLRVVTWTPFLRVPIGVAGMILVVAVAAHRVRLWRGEPLVEVRGRTMTLAALWGRCRIDRDDIDSIDVWMKSGQQHGLQVQLRSGKLRRIGFQPAGTSWYRVVVALNEWMDT